MGCMCCCFRPTDSRALEEPSTLFKTDESAKAIPQTNYGTISPEEKKPKKTSPSSSPRRSPTALLYSEPPESARVKSPELTSTTTSDTAPLVPSSGNASKADDSPRKTLAEIANLSRIAKSALSSSSSSAAADHKTRTSTPNPTVQNDSNTQVEDYHGEGVSSPAVSASVGVVAGSAESFESDTCHSPGQMSEEDEEGEEEEGEDERILRMLPTHPTAPSVASEGSEAQLVSRASTLTSSPGSSALDVSKDSSGKKSSKTKGLFKKAGKNMKKAKKKVGKGVERMFKHDKKKEDEEKEVSERERTTSTASTSTHDTSSSSSQFKRVSSDRMKSKYARDKLAALEKKREEEASHKAVQGFTDPRQAALERGEKLSELEEKTEQMREHAANFARNAHLLKERYASSS